MSIVFFILYFLNMCYVYVQWHGDKNLLSRNRKWHRKIVEAVAKSRGYTKWNCQAIELQLCSGGILIVETKPFFKTF